MISGNTARFAGGEIKQGRYADIAYDLQPQETRTGEEIKAHIVGKIQALNGGD